MTRQNRGQIPGLQKQTTVPFSLGNRPGALLLRSYFRSGWAFLIPYLAAYLLYAWLRWPVNVAAAGSTEQGAGSWMPCLLHVYWLLHCMHLILGVLALHSWWRSAREEQGSGTSVLRSPFSVLQTAVPWICLGLLFWIPGIYLEWPSDPWEHLRRINEWRQPGMVTGHSTWMKSGYFFPYSLTVFAKGAAQLDWLRVYHVGVCLLLSWQYYRLARAAGVGERLAILFVLLTPLISGNNVFSFHRYYGLSTSLWAHLAALALIRLAIEATGRWGVPAEATSSRLSRPLLLVSMGLLALLILGNHRQSAGIAGLGVGAVLCARWAGGRPWRIAAIPAILAALSLLAYIAISTSGLESMRASAQSGWLNRWYGFDLVSPASLAFQRAWDILGLVGFLNLGAAGLLVRARPLIAWLTLFSYLLLLSPLMAVPLSAVLQDYSAEVGITTFSRMLLGIPAGLALLVAIGQLVQRLRRLQSAASCLPALGLAGFMLLSPGHDAFNRAWHALYVAPADLSQTHLLLVADSAVTSPPADHLLLGSNVTQNILAAFHPRGPHPYFRNIHGSPPAWFSETIRAREALLDGTIPLAQGASRQMGEWLVFHTGKFSVPPDNRVGRTTDLSQSESAWTRLAGAHPVVTRHERGFEAQNPPGEQSYPLTTQRIPLSLALRYSVSASIRSLTGGTSRNYLAVAWYDGEDNMLPAGGAVPIGAGNPTGWHNGDLSYFGVIGASAPGDWRTFTKDFGLGTSAQIPRNAKYLRFAAILNDHSVPDAVIAIREVKLTTYPAYTRWNIVNVNPLAWVTPYSMAASLSRHWPANKVSLDLAGLPELESVFSDHAP